MKTRLIGRIGVLMFAGAMLGSCENESWTDAWVLQIDQDWGSPTERTAVMPEEHKAIRRRVEAFEDLAEASGATVYGESVEDLPDGRFVVRVDMPGSVKIDLSAVLKRTIVQFRMVSDRDDVFARVPGFDSLFAAYGVTVGVGPLAHTSYRVERGQFQVRGDGVATIADSLAHWQELGLLPPDVDLVWGTEDRTFDGKTKRSLYVLDPDTLITNEYCNAAYVTSKDGRPEITFELSPAGGQILEDKTAKYDGRLLAVVVNGLVAGSTLSIDGPIGRYGIWKYTGSLAEARSVAAFLATGPLPAPLKAVKMPTPSP